MNVLGELLPPSFSDSHLTKLGRSHDWLSRYQTRCVWFIWKARSTGFWPALSAVLILPPCWTQSCGRARFPSQAHWCMMVHPGHSHELGSAPSPHMCCVFFHVIKAVGKFLEYKAKDIIEYCPTNFITYFYIDQKPLLYYCENASRVLLPNSEAAWEKQP